MLARQKSYDKIISFKSYENVHQRRYRMSLTSSIMFSKATTTRKFIQNNMNDGKAGKPKMFKGERKKSFTGLYFKGDSLAETLIRRRNAAIRSAFEAVKL